MSKQEDNDNRILSVKTTHTGAFKQVIERMQNIISDCCIVFISPDYIDENNTDYLDKYYYESEHGEQISKTKSKKGKVNSEHEAEKELII